MIGPIEMFAWGLLLGFCAGVAVGASVSFWIRYRRWPWQKGRLPRV